MRTVILGGTGMLGHKLWQLWKSRPHVWVTVKRPTGTHPLFNDERVIPNVDASAFGAVADTLSRLQPDVVVDCIGIVKQAAAANDAVTAIDINALFPQRLAVLCRSIGARLIHISTDCVFSGRLGAYTEASLPDADDLYGRSKLLGEVGGSGCLTLRTSMIGREITRPAHGLVEWFLAQQGGRVAGYRHAVFSGFTTAALANVIDTIIRDHRDLAGVYHVAAEPISKLELLTMLNAALNARVTIDAVDEPHIDRSLDGTRFRAATGVIAPAWAEMVQQLAADPTPYDEWTKL